MDVISLLPLTSTSIVKSPFVIVLITPESLFTGLIKICTVLSINTINTIIPTAARTASIVPNVLTSFRIIFEGTKETRIQSVPLTSQNAVIFPLISFVDKSAELIESATPL